jgi:N-carbamoylputrescine amidase
MNSTVGNKDANVAKAKDLIRRAAERGADLVILPEFFNVEYFAQYRDIASVKKYIDYAEALDGPTLTQIASSARSHKIWVIATILEADRTGFAYDTAVLMDRNGARRGEYRKTHPGSVHSLEKMYFRAGSHFPVFDIEGWPTGIMICYDAQFPEVARILALNGAELIAAPFASVQHPLWRQRFQIRALENGCFVAVCNKVGLEGDWTFPGESLVAGPDGSILALASATEPELLVAEIDRNSVRGARRDRPDLRERRPDLYRPIVTPTEDLPSRE